MLATDQTVRMRPVAGIDAETVRVRPVDRPRIAGREASEAVPPVISGMDAKTVRHRIVDVAVKPLPSVIADRIPRTVSHRPSKWLAARVMLVLLLASMPILGISVDVFGLVSQGTTSIVVIALCAVLGAVIAFAPHRIDMIVGAWPDRRDGGVHRLRRGPAVAVTSATVADSASFFVVAFALGIDRGRARRCWAGLRRLPHWTGLIATVALAPHGQEMMFPLNPPRSRSPDRAPDLRVGSRARLPEGTARRGPSRMARPLLESPWIRRSQGQELVTYLASRIQISTPRKEKSCPPKSPAPESPSM